MLYLSFVRYHKPWLPSKFLRIFISPQLTSSHINTPICAWRLDVFRPKHTQNFHEVQVRHAETRNLPLAVGTLNDKFESHRPPFNCCKKMQLVGYFKALRGLPSSIGLGGLPTTYYWQWEQAGVTPRYHPGIKTRLFYATTIQTLLPLSDNP